jgi:2-polyprenyl-3-methyl-5-hydroxy-6-metoxy-1,4-benzoquinol methylase
MERICEPELMEDGEQARAYADTDFSAGDRAMVEALLDSNGIAIGRRILDLGCGPGNITFLLAERCPGATVLGVDGSAAMLAIAEARRLDDLHRCESVRFLEELLPCPSLAGERFSALVSNSLLHHLHDPALLWRSIAALAAPEAVVFVRDLRRPPDEQTLADLVRRHAAGLHPIVRTDYRNSLRAAFTVDEVRGQLAAAGLEGLLVTEVDEQYLQVEGRLPGGFQECVASQGRAALSNWASAVPKEAP